MQERNRCDKPSQTTRGMVMTVVVIIPLMHLAVMSMLMMLFFCAGWLFMRVRGRMAQRRARRKSRVVWGRVDEVFQGGVCCHPQVISRGRSTCPARGQKRPPDLLDPGPACLWSQFPRGKRLVAPTDAQ